MITLTGGGFTTPATATAVLTNGMVTSINVSGGSGYTSAPTVTIAPPPTSYPVTVLENGGLVTLFLTGISDGDVNTQTPLTFTSSVTNSTNVTNPAVKLITNVTPTYNGVSSINSTSFLTFTLSPNDSGTATINLTLMDGGPNGNGNFNSITVPITVNVVQVNQSPTLNAITNPATLTENGTGSAVAETPINLSGISDGVGDSGQILTVTAVSSNPALIPNPASATATLSGGSVGTIALASGGSGYAFPPVVTLTGGGFTTPATATAVLGTGTNAGVVTGINFTGGAGYTSAPVITIAPPTATAVAAATLTGGQVTAITTNGSIAAINGAINAITITNQGSGYTSTNPPAVTIAPPVSGTPATATAIVNSSGVVTGFTITNAGSGYSSASPPAITIAPPLITGTRATATATFTSPKAGYLEPAGGHDQRWRRQRRDGNRRVDQWHGHLDPDQHGRLGLHVGANSHNRLANRHRDRRVDDQWRHGERHHGRE